MAKNNAAIKTRSMVRVFALAVLPICLIGCSSEEHDDLRQWMKTQEQAMKPQVQELPALRTFAAVDYDAAALLDPFQVARLEPDRKRAKGGPDQTRRREPLEAYPLESLKMVGRMMMNGRPVALIKADNTIHQVKAGNYLGQNFGVVIKITDAEVTLKELIEDSNGDWVERVSTIQLQEQEAKK